MTQGERRKTFPKLVDKIEEIADYHNGENGFIHCNSYEIAQNIYDNLSVYVKRRTMLQDQKNREESLEKWMDSNKQIFLSVAQDEGISLDGDKARWQVVAKASYPFVGDERVSYRLNELGDWNWYNGSAVINLQQAAGRGMRSKDDWCTTYLIDSSFKSLLQRNRNLFEDWFLDAVNCDPADEVTAKVPESKFTFST
jgi:Rad3-related DNA helicases